MSDKDNYEEIVYECYGPAGSAFVIEALTDNKNRTAGDIRHIFEKSGGSMGTTNCVLFMFDRLGVVAIDSIDVDVNAIEEECIMLDGIQDFKQEDSTFVIYTEPSKVLEIAKVFEDKGYKVLSSQVEMVPQNLIELDESKVENFEKLLDKLDDNDDIQEYYHNVKY